MNDKFGNYIYAGTYVAYASRVGDSAKLRIGYVVEEPDLRIRAVDNWYNPEWKLLNGGKKFKMDYTERMIVIPAAIVPEELKKLLTQEDTKTVEQSTGGL